MTDDRSSAARRFGPVAALVIIVAIYGVEAGDALTRFPIVHGDEMWNAAPAYKLATTGVYGSDLFAGYFSAGTHTYQFMPMLQTVLALVFKFFGTGLLQMRTMSVAIGALVVVLTYVLGRQIGGHRLGLLASGILVMVPLASPSGTDTGLMLVDAVRTMRYHVLAALFGLAALVVFNRAEDKPSLARYAAAGACCGFAYLSHIYGAFWLPALVLVLLARRGTRALLSPATLSMLAAFVVICTPWIVYVLSDIGAYRAQTAMYADRFDVTNPSFYFYNVTHEVLRYSRFVSRSFFRWHPGGWLAALTLPFAIVWTSRAAIRNRSSPLFATLVALAALIGLFALFIRWKTFTYLLTPLPLAVVVLASGWRHIWDSRPRPLVRIVAVTALLAIATEAGIRLWHRHLLAAQTTPYDRIEEELSQQIPANSRVLISHRFWLGLRDRDVRTWLVPLLGANCGACDKTRTLDQILETFAPDVVAVDDLEFGPYFDTIRDPAHPMHWQSVGLDAYFAKRGLTQYAEVRDASYGTIRLYR